MVSLVIDAVPPPFCPPLVENKKLKFGGEASVRTTGASVPSHAILMSVLDVRPSCLSRGILKTQFGLKTVLGVICLCEILVLMVWMLFCASGATEQGACIV